MGKQRIIVVNMIDWSKSFVDKNGAFYCMTTVDQIKKAAEVLEIADLIIYTTDLHPIKAPEHRINGGAYPAHNACLPERFGPDFVYHITPDGKNLELGDKTLSPCLTRILQDAVEDKKTGIIVPKGVYFQAESKEPWFMPGDIEKTFGKKIITTDDFLEGDYEYIIAPKPHFDATRVDSDIRLPRTKIEGIPDVNYTVYDLLLLKYPADEYEIVHVNTGVVEDICRLHTSVGERQQFYGRRVINLLDATTALAGVGLGFEKPVESRDACRCVCMDISIEYMTTKECMEDLAA